MKTQTLRIALMLTLALLVPFLLIACGDADEGLTRADVSEIVRSEIANAPALEPGLTGPQVEQIVREALDDIKKPEQEPTSKKVEQMADGKMALAPRRSSPSEYTQYLVKNAISKYDSEGLDATLAYYNTKESIDGQWYVFIINDDVMLAHAANPDLVGRPASAAIGPNGYPAGEAVAAVADEDGAWFDYTFPNPATGAAETKHSWMVRYDGLVFGTGWHEGGPRKSNAPAYTQSFVRQALDLYDALGLEATLAYYNTKESVDGQWYLFIIDQDDVMLAHAGNPDLVGRPSSVAVGPNGYPAAEAVAAVADEDGAWLSYTFPNPATGTAETKHSWMVLHDGLVFGSGWYERGPSKSDAPRIHQVRRPAGPEPLRHPGPGGGSGLLQLEGERRRPVVRLHSRRRRLHHSPPQSQVHRTGPPASGWTRSATSTAMIYWRRPRRGAGSTTSWRTRNRTRTSRSTPGWCATTACCSVRAGTSGK